MMLAIDICDRRPAQTIHIRSKLLNYLESIMHDRFESLESGEVISVQHDIQVLSGHHTFRVGELNNAIESHLKSAIANWNEENNGWFTSQGIDCEALRFGSQGWQKGRIRLCLEFCPDEPNPPAQSAIKSQIPPAVNAPINAIGHPISAPVTPPSPPVMTGDVRHEEPVAQPIAAVAPTPVVAPASPDKLAAAIPVAAGIGAIGAVVTAAAIATPDLKSPHADTTLELEEEHHHSGPSAPHSGSLEEIAFDFDDLANQDRGKATPNGMMELDLTDLDLDFAEQDLLDFDANDMSDASAEFANFQNISKSENSGMLIDEVWNEMNQGNWPKIN
jgi:KGK domain